MQPKRPALQPRPQQLAVPPSRAEITARRAQRSPEDPAPTKVRLADLPRRLIIEQAAAFLKIPPILAHRAVETGDLPMINMGGQPIVDTGRLLADLGIPDRHGRSDPT